MVEAAPAQIVNPDGHIWQVPYADRVNRGLAEPKPRTKTGLDARMRGGSNHAEKRRQLAGLRELQVAAAPCQLAPDSPMPSDRVKFVKLVCEFPGKQDDYELALDVNDGKIIGATIRGVIGATERLDTGNIGAFAANHLGANAEACAGATEALGANVVPGNEALISNPDGGRPIAAAPTVIVQLPVGECGIGPDVVDFVERITGSDSSPEAAQAVTATPAAGVDTTVATGVATFVSEATAVALPTLVGSVGGSGEGEAVVGSGQSGVAEWGAFWDGVKRNWNFIAGVSATAFTLLGGGVLAYFLGTRPVKEKVKKQLAVSQVASEESSESEPGEEYVRDYKTDPIRLTVLDETKADQATALLAGRHQLSFREGYKTVTNADGKVVAITAELGPLREVNPNAGGTHFVNLKNMMGIYAVAGQVEDEEIKIVGLTSKDHAKAMKEALMNPPKPPGTELQIRK